MSTTRQRPLEETGVCVFVEFENTNPGFLSTVDAVTDT